jgi:hypothetical protein
MPMLPMNTDKLKAMRTDWTAQAATRALAVKKLRDRVADGRKTGAKFTADEVASALALVAEFYVIEGRVKMVEEILADLLGKTVSTQPMPAPKDEGGWRLPPR